MSALVAAVASIASVLVAATNARRRTRDGIALTAVTAVFAVVAIGRPELRGSDGFLVEPLRAFGALAVLLAFAGSAIAGSIRQRKSGLLVAGVLLSLLSGHAALALGGMVLASASLLPFALNQETATLHAAVPSRLAALLSLKADALLAVALLVSPDGLMEPVAMAGLASVLVVISTLFRIAAGVALTESPALSLTVCVSALVPVVWLSAGGSSVLAIGAAAGACVAAYRAAFSSRPASGSAVWALLAVSAAASGSATSVLVPLLLIVSVAWVLMTEIAPGLTPYLSAAPGVAGFLAVAAFMQRSEAGVLQVALAATAALVVTVGAFGLVRPPDRIIGTGLERVAVAVPIAGLLALAAAASDPLNEVISRQIVAAHIASPLGFHSSSIFPSWAPVASLSVLALWALFEFGPLRSMVPARQQQEARTSELPASAEYPFPATWWALGTAALSVAGVLALAVLIRSALRGWL